MTYATWREVSRSKPGGLAEHQAGYRASEAAANRVGVYQPSLIPGLVQTPAYARELLALPGGPMASGASQDEVEALVAERRARQELLYEPGRRVELVINEAALHNRPGSRDTMRGQLEQLATLAGLATIELGVIPFTVPMPIMPICGFSLDDDLVYIESLSGEQRLYEPEEVAVYTQAFDVLRAAAAEHDAITLIREALEQL